jgi:ribosome recycling factor
VLDALDGLRLEFPKVTATRRKELVEIRKRLEK